MNRLAGLVDRRARGIAAADRVDEVVHRRLAAAVFDDDIDDPKVAHLLSAVDLAAEDQLLSTRTPDLPRQEGKRPHAGEQIEQDLRQAELGTLLSDDQIVCQRRFETAAESIALDERNADKWPVDIYGTRILDINTSDRIRE